MPPRLALVVILVTLSAAPVVRAHEVRPGYLELRQTGAETYAVLWKVPAAGQLRLSIHPHFPENCKMADEVTSYRGADSYSERSSIACPGGLSGRTVAIDGLTATQTDVLVRLERADGSTQVARLKPSAPAFTVEAVPHRMGVVRTYLVLGIEHILTGVDHLLFVSGLLLLVSGFGRLVKTISAFTVSHSVTLTLATLGFVRVPPRPVEAVIALSILFVACEIVRSRNAPLSLAQRKPWLVAFTFGLLHGLGFAGGLSAAGLPAGHIPLALGLFSAGVEVGHFTFVAAVLTLMAVFRREKLGFPSWAHPVPAYAIGGLAAFWVIARVVAL